MKIHIVRTTRITRIIRNNTTNGGGQSLRQLVGEVTMLHDQWIYNWEDSKPMTKKEMQELKDEMLQLAKEAGL